MLAARLKELVADGVLERRRYRTDPDWYEYVLSDSGRDLYGAVAAVLRWADLYLPDPEDPQLRLHHRPCGQQTHAKVVCSVCGEELDPRDVVAELDEPASADVTDP